MKSNGFSAAEEKRKNTSLVTKIALFVLTALIVCSAAIGIFAYALERSQIITESAKRSLAIAQTVSSALDAEQYAEIVRTGEPNDYYVGYKTYLDETLEKCDIIYLYILDKNYGSEVTYFAEGYPAAGREDEPEILLGNTEAIEVYPDELFETLKTGDDSMTGIYNLGGFGSMVSGFSPILDQSGNILGVVGVDLAINEAMASANRFGLFMIVIIAVMCSVVAVIIVWYIRKSIGKPIKELAAAADKLALGTLDVSISTGRNDEIGLLVSNFTRMIDSTNEQARMLELLADGDLTIDVRPRCEKDMMGNALAAMVANLNGMFAGINSGTVQVSDGSKKLADGSQTVAQGSAEQSSAVERLLANIRTLADGTAHNAKMAKQAAGLSDTVRTDAEKGNAQMEQMLQAVREINDASKSIEKVIKVIDDIAFQTNILALNASVEAARAGQHGKGFAVVAEEVRSLAGKSVDAAKDTGRLISNSMEKTALGTRIAEETSSSLRGIVEGVNRSTAIVNEIASLCGEQASSIDEITQSVTQVTQVIRQNSATAQESAAASVEISGQADILQEMVARFRLRSGLEALPVGHWDY